MHEIHVTEDVIDMIQQLSESAKFKELKDAANERPEKLAELLTFIHDEYPALHDLFSTSPHFLMSIISGNVPAFDEDEDEEDAAPGEAGAASTPESGLTDQDREAIRNVGLPAGGHGVLGGKVH